MLNLLSLRKSNLEKIKTKNVQDKLYDELKKKMAQSGEELPTVSLKTPPKPSESSNKALQEELLDPGFSQEELTKPKNVQGVISSSALNSPTATYELSYNKLKRDAERWQRMAERYYQDKQFLEKQIRENRYILLKNLFTLKFVIRTVEFLRVPGIISLLLILNFLLLLYIGVGTMKDVGTLRAQAPKPSVSQAQNAKLPFTIQTSVFDEFSEANEMVDDLQQLGYDAYISKLFNSKNDVYRVYLGNFKTVKDASKVLKQLKKDKLYKGSFVRTRWE